jgi:hypothetical protein
LFNAYENVSDVIQELPFVINVTFRQRLELIVAEGVVFN